MSLASSTPPTYPPLHQPQYTPTQTTISTAYNSSRPDSSSVSGCLGWFCCCSPLPPLRAVNFNFVVVVGAMWPCFLCPSSCSSRLHASLVCLCWNHLLRPAASTLRPGPQLGHGRCSSVVCTRFLPKISSDSHRTYAWSSPRDQSTPLSMCSLKRIQSLCSPEPLARPGLSERLASHLVGHMFASRQLGSSSACLVFLINHVVSSFLSFSSLICVRTHCVQFFPSSTSGDPPT
jgi:hypothetical protein